jgi:hypothetical protein
MQGYVASVRNASDVSLHILPFSSHLLHRFTQQSRISKQLVCTCIGFATFSPILRPYSRQADF